MKSLILTLMLATTTLVQAQQLNFPKTIKLHSNQTGEHLGTITVSGNTAYVRDKNGELVYTMVQNPDGTKTTFDPNGNIIAPIKLPE